MDIKKSVYAFIPIGVALVAGGIQTAAIAATFTSAVWHISAILTGCVWLTVAMDAAAFHHSVLNGAARGQKVALWLSALSLVTVLAIDLVILVSPQAFDTTNEIVKNLHFAPGVNLAVSAICLLAWIFFDEAHAAEQETRQDEANLIREKRLEFLDSREADQMYADMIRDDYLGRVASRRKRTKFALLSTRDAVTKSMEPVKPMPAPFEVTPELLSEIAGMVKVSQADPNGGTHPKA